METLEPVVMTPQESPDRIGMFDNLHSLVASSDAEVSRSWSSSPRKLAVNLLQPEGSDASPPLFGNGYSRFATSRGPAIRQVTARASYENTILAAVRKQMDTYEEKLGAQISRLQQQTNRFNEAAFARLEEKMHTIEGCQTKADRRMAELTGNCKGLSDEISAQIRRVDSMDERLWDFRHEKEKDSRQRFQALGDQIIKVSSANKVMCASLEDEQKRHTLRLQRIELDAGDSLVVHEETREALKILCGRLEAVEASAAEREFSGSDQLHGIHGEQKMVGANGDDSSALVSLLERRIGVLSGKLDSVMQDSMELHSESKLQEEQLKGLRSLVDAREDRIRGLVEKERSAKPEFEIRLEQVKRQIDEDGSRTEHMLELLGKKVENQEELCEKLESRQAHLLLHRERQPISLGSSLENGIYEGAQECPGCFPIECSEKELLETPFSFELAAQISGLVEQLQDLAPKVMAMDTKSTENSQNLDNLARDFDDLKVHLDEAITGVVGACLEVVRGELRDLESTVKGRATEFRLDSEWREQVIADTADVVAQRLLQHQTKDEVGMPGLAELAREVQKDDEEERETYKALLAHIDDLCKHIASVENAVGCLVERSLVDFPSSFFKAEDTKDLHWKLVPAESVFLASKT